MNKIAEVIAAVERHLGSIGVASKIIRFDALTKKQVDEDGVPLYAGKHPLAELPQDATKGDISVRLAYALAGELKCKPEDAAKAIADAVKKVPDCSDVRIERGHVNIFLAQHFLGDLIRHAAENGDYAKGESKKAKVNVEHTSANPTGPVHIAHGRQASVGDSICRIMKFAGYEVVREFYLNDSGGQVEKLGKSVYARLRQFESPAYPFPEDGYHGDYIKEIAETLKDVDWESEQVAIEGCARKALEVLRKQMFGDLKDFRVEFDKVVSQKELEESGRVEELVDRMKDSDITFEKDGGLYFRATEFGDGEDRILIKTNGEYTYRTTDFLYHVDKFERRHDFVLTLLGPDHHGHIITMTSFLKAMAQLTEWVPGDAPDRYKVVVIQHCRLLRGGEEVKMSKRAASYVTLRELMDEVGTDAARFFFVMRKAEQHLDFDLDVAKKQTMDNPVFYVQYAHARIKSIFAKANETGLMTELKDADFSKLHENDLGLARYLFRFCVTVQNSAREQDPSIMTVFLRDLAGYFQSYYEKGDKDKSLRVLCDDAATRNARLVLCNAIANVLKKGLELVGVSAPDHM